MDNNPTRALPSQAYSTNTNTPAQCALACRKLGYKYAGTEYSAECWCGNYLPSIPADASQCSTKCAGDSTQYCGAGNRLSVTVDSTWQQTFFARQNYTTWNLMSCYIDGSTRTLPVGLGVIGGGANMTAANCLDACTAKGYPYCGMEYAQECWAGMAQPSASLALAGDPLQQGCNYVCRGNSSEACGGSDRLLLFYNSALVTPQ